MVRLFGGDEMDVDIFARQKLEEERKGERKTDSTAAQCWCGSGDAVNERKKRAWTGRT